MLLLLMSLCWASVFLFVKVADQVYPPMMIVAFRAVLGAVVLLLVGIVLRKPLLSLPCVFSVQGMLALCGLLIGYLWFVIAQSELLLSAAVASLIPATSTMFAWVICVFLMRSRRFQLINCVGIGLALVGVATIIGWRHLLHDSHNMYAVLLLSSGFLALTVNSILLKQYLSAYDTYVLCTYSVIYAALFSVLLWWFTQGGFDFYYSADAFSAMVAAGVISTGLGYLLFFVLAKNSGAVFTSLFGYFVPIFGFSLSAVFLHEVITLEHLLGGFVVLAGVALINRQQSVTV